MTMRHSLVLLYLLPSAFVLWLMFEAWLRDHQRRK
jgi:hypothetical protein